jgi:hypothetical protein
MALALYGLISECVSATHMRGRTEKTMELRTAGILAALAAGVLMFPFPSPAQEAIIIVRHSDPPPMRSREPFWLACCKGQSCGAVGSGNGQGSDDLWNTASKPFELDQECHGNLLTAELLH